MIFPRTPARASLRTLAPSSYSAHMRPSTWLRAPVGSRRPRRCRSGHQKLRWNRNCAAASAKSGGRGRKTPAPKQSPKALGDCFGAGRFEAGEEDARARRPCIRKSRLPADPRVGLPAGSPATETPPRRRRRRRGRRRDAERRGRRRRRDDDDGNSRPATSRIQPFCPSVAPKTEDRPVHRTGPLLPRRPPTPARPAPNPRAP